MTEIVLSKRGFSFTRGAVQEMRDFAAELPATETLSWAVSIVAPGVISPCLGTYDTHALPSAALFDEVDGIPFVWGGPGKELDFIRAHCIDLRQGRLSRLIDLPEK